MKIKCGTLETFVAEMKEAKKNVVYLSNYAEPVEAQGKMYVVVTILVQGIVGNTTVSYQERETQIVEGETVEKTVEVMQRLGAERATELAEKDLKDFDIRNGAVFSD